MLELKNVSKKYGERFALQNISLSLTEGIYGILGPNGAGKSTLMNLITDNLQADSGEIWWNGKPVKELGAAYRRILGYAPQQQGIYDTFTGRRFLSYMGTLKEIPRNQIKTEIETTAAYVNLTEKLDNPIGTYSGGMKQRLLIAQAMVGSPKLLILDEPTAGLDPKERVNIREKIKSLAEGKIILMATHVVSDIESIAKEIILLKSGEIAAKNSIETLCREFDGAAGLEEVYMTVFGEEAQRV